MGVSVKLLPQFSKGADFSDMVLNIDTNGNFISALKEIENNRGREVQNGGIHSHFGADMNYEGLCYGETYFTPYGKVMKGIQAKDILPALDELNLDYWKNRAIIAFLKELPPNLEIWLYWD